MARLKRLGVLFSAKLKATLMAFIGLIAGIVYAFGGALYELLTGTLNTGTALAFLALAGMPLLFAACGFVSGAIGAVLYNLVSRRFGGIGVDFELEG